MSGDRITDAEWGRICATLVRSRYALWFKQNGGVVELFVPSVPGKHRTELTSAAISQLLKRDAS